MKTSNGKWKMAIVFIYIMVTIAIAIDGKVI